MEKLGINTTLFLTQMVNFLIMVFILQRFLYKPILKMIKERQEKISDGLALAENMAGEKEKLGKEREKMGKRGIYEPSELESLRFYPLEEDLSPVVKVYLQAKEVNFLLHKIQQSLDIKMNKENTKPFSQKVRDRYKTEHRDDYDDFLKSQGLRRLENGRVVGLNDPDPVK